MTELFRDLEWNGKKYRLIMEDINLSHPEGPKGAVFEMELKTNKVMNPDTPLYQQTCPSSNDRAWLWNDLDRFVKRR